jgi:hypothetical protein
MARVRHFAAWPPVPGGVGARPTLSAVAGVNGATHKFIMDDKICTGMVDKVRGRPLYSTTRRAAARRDDAPAKLLTDNDDQPSDL